MRLASFTALLLSATFVYCVAPAAAQSDVKTLAIQSGHSLILAEPGLTRVAVGDSQIAGVLPIGTQQVVINGKTPGRTTVFVWNKHGRMAYEVDVTQQEIYDLSSLVRDTIEDPGVSVTSTEHTIVVHGTVESIEQYSRLANILLAFDASAKAQKITIINTVTMLHPLGSLSEDIKNIPGAGAVRVDPDGKGDVIVSGFVEDRTTAEHILGHVRGLAAPYLSVDGKIVDRLETATSPQIDIKVNVLEVDDTAQRTLGNDLQSAVFNPSSGTWTFGIPSFPLIEGNVAGTQPKGFTFNAGFSRISLLSPTLNALITEGHARSLSSPDLTTLPGTEANFLVGGQIPYVTSTGLGQTSVAFQPYGVQLKVTPTILANGSIQAVVAPVISELDEANAVVQNGFSIPALTTSSLSTTAVTRPGESIILGGMMRHLESRTISKWPFLGNLPILGKLFSSTNYQNNKTNIVFVLTPSVINR